MRQILSPPLALLAFVILATGCIPFGIGGSVDGRDLSFTSATYFEFRGLNVATAIEFHQIDLWLMPMEDPCNTFPGLLTELGELRSQIADDSMLPEDYCAQWETAFEDLTGLEGFWMTQVRLNALPRDENEDIVTDYLFVDDASEAIPSGPHFDASLAWYPPATFSECAQEFSGSTIFGADHFGADGGVAKITRYEEDAEITVQIEPSFPTDGGGLRGQAKASFCPAASEWPIDFGLGL